jgi:hypothetical protein
MQRMNGAHREHLTDIVAFANADGARAAERILNAPLAKRSRPPVCVAFNCAA